MLQPRGRGSHSQVSRPKGVQKRGQETWNLICCMTMTATTMTMTMTTTTMTMMSEETTTVITATRLLGGGSHSQESQTKSVQKGDKKNVEFDLLDDSGDNDDDDDDDVGGSNEDGKDGDDGDKTAGKGGQVDDYDDDESYHDDGKDLESDLEHSEVVVEADQDLDDDEDSATSGQKRENET
jgi:hypothetical protein